MLYKSDATFLTYVGDIPYLIPFAQNICDRCPLLAINDTGADIWGNIGEGIEEADLIISLSKLYDIKKSDMPSFTDDISSFINELKRCHALTSEKPASYAKKIFDIPIPEPCDKSYILQAAGLNLSLETDERFLHEELSDFIKYDTPENIDQRVIFVPEYPQNTGRKMIIDDPLLMLFEYENGYLYYHPENISLKYMFVTRDAATCIMYYDDSLTDTLTDEIYFALRESFLLLSSLHDMYCLHSASIKYNDLALLFSGPSGMGKSTHTSLWNKYEHTTYINGDLNMLCIEDSKPVIKGIPWCGTSKVNDDKTYHTHSITLLNKGSDNLVTPSSFSEKVTGVFMRITSPRFDSDMTKHILSFLEKYCEMINVEKYSCTISKEAVDVIKDSLF